MKKTITLFSLLLLAGFVGLGLVHASEGYKYISAKELSARLDTGAPMIIIDICSVEQFAEGHIKGSMETNAYPVKTDAERARLAELLPKVKSTSEDVVVVCPRGGGGAKRTVEYYKSNGVEENRLLILEKGMTGWPYETEKK